MKKKTSQEVDSSFCYFEEVMKKKRESLNSRGRIGQKSDIPIGHSIQNWPKIGHLSIFDPQNSDFYRNIEMARSRPINPRANFSLKVVCKFQIGKKWNRLIKS